MAVRELAGKPWRFANESNEWEFRVFNHTSGIPGQYRRDILNLLVYRSFRQTGSLRAAFGEEVAKIPPPAFPLRHCRLALQ